MTEALVLDGEQRAALAVARSLARKGLRVESASMRDDSLVAASRAVAASHRSPDPAHSVSRYLEWLGQFPRETVLPITDATTMLVRSCATQGDQGYEQLTNKAELLTLAAANGVPAPRGEVVCSTSEARTAAASIGYPVALKPSRSKVLIADRVVSSSVQVVGSAGDLERALSAADWFPELPAIVQEFVPGHGAGIFCLFDRDRALAWFAHRRLREKPPSGGVSVLCESIPVDACLQAYSEALLSGAAYRGVAMVEFRIGADGRPYLMEVNARFWGSLQLAIDCGVDFPWMYWQMLRGYPLAPVAGYLVGRRLRWLLGDFDNLLLCFRDPALGVTQKLERTAAFVGSSFDPHSRQEVLRWADPSPGLREARQWLADLTRRR